MEREIDTSEDNKGQSKPSTGNVSAPKDAVVAYLPQHLLTTDGAVVEEAQRHLAKFSA
jgi:ATP-binding cassette subfamily F protein 3